MINPSIEYDYLIKFLALGDSGVGELKGIFSRKDRRNQCTYFFSLEAKQHFCINTPMANSIQSLFRLLESIFEKNVWFIDQKQIPMQNRIEFTFNFGIRSVSITIFDSVRRKPNKSMKFCSRPDKNGEKNEIDRRNLFCLIDSNFLLKFSKFDNRLLS